MLVISLPISLFSQVSENDRKAFEKFINEHPFSNRKHQTPKELKKLPKNERPDFAYEQDYLRTLDPSTGKPEVDKLFPLFQQSSQPVALTPGIPGSTTFPWVERGPNNVGGRTRALMWDPNAASGNKVWAGGVTGGLWYNNDITSATSQWQAVNDFWDNIAVTCIAYDPNNTQIMYVGTGESFTGASRGAGIWKTTNGGTSWTQLASTSNFYYVNDIVVRDESGSSVIYAAVDGRFYNGTFHGSAQAGLQRSTNGGTSWTQVLPNVPGESFNYVAADIEIAADDRIWIGSDPSPYGGNDRGGGRILFSDNGTTWVVSTSVSVANGRGRVEVACAPSDANVVYALVENNRQLEAILKTTNKGFFWDNSNTSSAVSEPSDADNGIPATDFTRGQATYDLIAAVDPLNANRLIIGGINLHRSNNGGQTWQQISKWSNNPNMNLANYSLVHADQHAIAFKPGQTGFASQEVIFGTDGGVYWSNSIVQAANQSVISGRNNGYNVTQFYAAALTPTANGNLILGGTQDNGTQEFSISGMNSTTEKTGGDGAFCFIDQTEPNIQITSYVFNNYYLYNGSSFQGTIINENNTGSFINVADYDDIQNVLYTYKTPTKLYKVRNITATSAGILDSVQHNFGTTVTALKVSPYTTTSSKLFVGTSAGRLFRINNANGNSPQVTEITPTNFPTASISSIEFGNSENEILITFFNYGVTSVWYSNNGGNTFVSKEGTGATQIPDMPIRWGLINPNNANEVILATEVGVWSTSNFLAANPNWSASTTGLANVRVDMFQTRTSDDEVIAATHGRGMFSSSAFGNTSGINLISNVIQPNCGGNTGSIAITVTGGTAPFSYSWSSGDTTSAISNLAAGTYKVVVTDFSGAKDSLTEVLSAGSAISGLPYNESFESGFGDWYNDTVNDDIDFTINFGGTTSGGTGPSAAQDGSFYIYTEASGPPFGSGFAGAEAFLISKCVDFTSAQNPFISFFNHQLSGNSNPSLTLEADSGNGVWNTLFSQTGSQGNQWKANTVFLNAYAGKSVIFRFKVTVGTTGSFFQNDVALDNIYISGNSPLINIFSVNQPNCGSTSGGSISVTSSGGSGNIGYSWNTGDTTSQLSNLIPGVYAVSVYDNGQLVDSNQMEIFTSSVVTTYPFSTGFENSFDGFINLNDDQLDWFFETGGTPTGGTGPTGPFEGNFYLRIESSAPNVGLAAPGDIASLVSPCFDLTVSNNPFVSFAKHSFSQGNNNPILSFWGDTSNGNWFLINSDTGNLGFNWLADTFDLSPFSGKQIRFKFDARVADIGLQQRSDIALDNFHFAPYRVINLNSTQITQGNCHNGNPGSIVLNPSGGIPPYTYSWNTGDTTSSISNLQGGLYSVTVNDQVGQSAVYASAINGSQSMQSFPYNENFEGSFGFWLNETTADQIDWFIDSANTPSGGTGPTAPSAGNYYIRIEASAPPLGNASPGDTAILNGPCVDLSGATLPYISFDNHQWSLNQGGFNPTPQNCRLTLEADSGNGNWFELFKQVGDQGNQWNSDTVLLNQFIGNTLKFRFIAKVADTGSSRFRSDIALDKLFITKHNPLFFANKTVIEPSCGAFDGSISLTIAGGLGPYNFNWSTGDTTSSINNLFAGNYNVTVTDAYNQTIDTSFQIGSYVGSFPAAHDWENGFGLFTQEQVNDDFDWTLRTGATPSNLGNNGITGPTAANTGNFYIYTEASVPRQNNDSAIFYSPCIDLNNLPAPIFTMESHQWGSSSMSIEVLADSGNGIWNSIFFSQGNQGNQWNFDTIELFHYIDKNIKLKFKGVVLAQGGGQVIWQGDNAIDEITIQPGEAFKFDNALITQPTCNNSTDGELEIEVSGGYSPYTFSWNGSASTTNIASSLTGGTYQVTVQDKYGRTIDTSFTLLGTGNLALTKNIIDVDCNGNSTGSATLSVSGGVTPYTYNWSGVTSTSNTISGVSAGTYLVTITDSVNCQTVDSVIISQPQLLTANISFTPILCNGDSTGTATVSISGGTTPYDITWSNGLKSPTISNLNSNFYSVIVIDSNFCSANDLQFLAEPLLPLVLQDSAIDETCPGAANGVAGVLATGGIQPYTYTWPAGVFSNQPIATGLTSGNYTVSVTDSIGCQKTTTINISAPSGPTVNFDSVPDLCLGASAITLNATPLGGTFSGPGVTGNIFNPSGLGTGSFTLSYVYADTAGCTDSASQVVNIDSVPNVTLFPIASLCQNAPIFNLTGGSPLSGNYFINGNPTTVFDPSLYNPGGVNIKYQVTNQCGTDSAVVQTSVLNTPFANAGPNQSIAAGSIASLNGVINSFNTSGVGSIWLPDSLVVNPFDDTTNTVNLLVSTSFVLVAVDTSTGCSTKDTTIVSVSSTPLTTTISTSADTICNGGSVLLNVNATGGTGNYSYSWAPASGISTPNAASTNASPAATTKYFVTVNDGLTTTTDSIEITVLPLPSASINFPDTFCVNEPAMVLSGGLPLGGSYQVNGFTAINFDPSGVGIGTQNLTYTFTDNFGCTNSASQSIEVIGSPSVTLAPFSNLCSNNNPISLAGGTPAGGVFSGVGVSNNTFSPSISGAGTFTIKYTYGVGGCVDSATQSITVNAAPTVNTGNDTTITAGNFVSLNPIVTGSNLSYLWTPDTAVINSGVANTNTINLNSSLGLNLVVTDTVNNCSSTDGILISVVGGQLSVNVSAASNMICDGDSVQLNALASGGSGNYTYQWNNSGVLNQSNIFNPIAKPTTTTQFSVTVSDGVNNTIGTVAINVNPKPIVTVDPFGPFCEGDSLQPLPLGVPSGGVFSGMGVSGTSFDPSLAGVGSSLITYLYTDVNGCSSSANQQVTIHSKPTVSFGTIPSLCSNDAPWALFQGSPIGGSYSGLGVANGVFDPSIGQGNYPIVYQYTDANGCSDTANYNVTVNNAPFADAGPNQSVPLNFNTQLFGVATSNSGQLGYSWNPAGLLINPTDLQPNTVSMTQSTQFTLTVNDSATGCSSSDQVTILVTGGPLSVSLLVSNDTICEGDSISLNTLVTGGVGQKTFKWNTNAITDTTIGNPKAAPTVITTYIVTVSDSLTSVTDTVTVLVNTAPQISFNLPPNICNGDGNLALNQGLPAGGAYSGNGVSGNIFNPIAAGVGTKTLTYTLTDPNTGCSSSAQSNIQVNATPNANLILANDTTCQDGNSLLLTGGSPAGGVYSWLGNQNSLFNPSGLNLGKYVVEYEVNSAQGCSDKAVDTVYVNGAPQVALNSLTDVGCNGDTTGSIDISIQGGVSPITTIWTNGVFTEDLTNIPAGSYSVLVQDAAGCFTNKNYVVSQSQPINISFNSQDVLCFGDQTGQTFANVAGGNSPYSLNWSNGANTFLNDSLGQGFYNLTITDAKGCKDSNTVQIFEPQPLVSVLSKQDLSCFQSGDGSATTNVNGGIAPYTYNWESGSMGNTALNISAGFQSITVTDSNGCVLADSINVLQPPKINIGAFAVGSTSICVGGTVFLNANPINYPNYQWKLNGVNISGANSPVYQASLGGNYAIQATDSNGCKATSTPIQVQVLPNPNIQFTGVSSNYCENQDSVILFADPAGGTFTGPGVANNLFNPSSLNLGSYQLQYAVTDSNGCSDSNTVRVNIRPRPIIGSLIGATMVQPNNTYTYAINANNGSQYTWSASGGNVISTTNNLATIQWGAPGTGEISVVETNYFGCLDTADFFISIGIQIGQNELGKVKELKVYPNPVNDVLFVELSNPDDKDIQIQIIAPTGSIVYNETISELNLLERKAIDFSNYASGMYFLKISGDTFTRQLPLVVQ